MSVRDENRPAPSRRREVIGGAVAALVVLAVVVLGLLVRGGDDGDVAAAGTTTPSSSSAAASPPASPPQGAAPGTPDQAAPPDAAAELPRSLPAVAFDEEVVGEDGVRARVVALEAVDGTAEGVGNVAGPALRATVRLTNGTAEPVVLGRVSVTLTHGPDGTPASPLDDPSVVPFSGTLSPDGSAQATYVFTVPEDDREVVTLTVGYGDGVPFLVFTGAAG